MPKPLVVMVSTDTHMIEIYKELFDEEGISIKHVPKGEKAFKIIKERKPIAVLLDMAIAGEDGFDLIGKMKKYQTLKKMPIVVLSHVSDEADVKRARKLGVTHYCLKLHCHPERIVKRVTDLIE
ncbi:MAG: hypothetical protein CMI52_04605 [Parcubacteria group bacterium]|nr:hypothetical protein [Parcubacteria group bacterium]|tara:strand:- start:2077 stop:2448 length:372 start_codon:yes stop_codon:yes gene_type:complete